MSINSDEVQVEDSWKIDLEIALLEDADSSRIRSICANRPLPSNSRPEVWRICLRPDLQNQQTMTTFGEVYDLPNQAEVHADCERAAAESLDRIVSLQKSLSASLTSLTDSEDDIDHLQRDMEDPALSAHVPSVTKLTCDFEAVLTHFVQTYSLSYNSNSGWVSILRILYEVLKPVDRQELYACFSAVFHRFVPNGTNIDLYLTNAFHILLQYHDPKLSRLLDSLRLGPEAYAVPWLLTLFSHSTITDLNVVLALWDIYFLASEPLLGLFISLVLLINVKSTLLKEQDVDESSTGGRILVDGHGTRENFVEGSVLSTCDRDEALRILLDLPKPMQVDDVSSLMELTQLFTELTPLSFRAQCVSAMFGPPAPKDICPALTGALCLSVSVHEVVQAQSMASTHHDPVDAPGDTTSTDNKRPTIRYLVVDCRSAEQYNAGHLNTAFFLDSSLMLSDPSQIYPTVKSLLQSQKRAITAGSHAAGEHITLLSCGRPEEDQVTNIVVAAFLRLDTPYVSIVGGGYGALHEFLRSQGLTSRLVDHEPHKCSYCSKLDSKSEPNEHSVTLSIPSATSTAHTGASLLKPLQAGKVVGSLFTKFSSTFFGSPPSTLPESTKNHVQTPYSPAITPDDRSVGTHDRTKRTPERLVSYRNTSSVFSIDDDDEEEEEELEQGGFTENTSDQTQLSTNVETSSGITRSNQPVKKKVFWPFSLEQKSLPAGDIPSRPSGLDSSEPGDLIDTTQWSCRPEVRGVFDCQLIDRQGRLAETGYLVLVERHVLLLSNRTHRDTSLNLVTSIGSALQSVFSRPTTVASSTKTALLDSKHAQVLRSVPINLIMRITANRRVPECITFQYATQDPSDLLLLNEPALGTRDRLYLPQAGEAVRMVKSAIYEVCMSSS